MRLREQKKMKYIIIILALVSCASLANCDEEKALQDQQIDNMFAKGKLYLDEGNYDEAINYFEEVSLNYPEVEDLDYYLGFLYFKKGEITKAEEHFLKVVERDPFSAEAYYYLGIIENRRGNHEMVIEYLDRVTSLDNRFHSAYFNKGITYLKLDMPEKAVQEFGHALSLSPRDTASFQGMLEAYKKMDLIETTKESNPDTNRIIKERKKSAGVTFEVFVVSPQEKEQESVGKDETILLENTDNALEIRFSDPEDLSSKAFQLQAKSSNKDSGIKVVIIDKDTKRSPDIYMTGINKKWNSFSIDILEKAGYYLDISNVKSIRIQLEPKEPSEKERIYIRNIDVR